MSHALNFLNRGRASAIFASTAIGITAFGVIQANAGTHNITDIPAKAWMDNSLFAPSILETFPGTSLTEIRFNNDWAEASHRFVESYLSFIVGQQTILTPELWATAQASKQARAANAQAAQDLADSVIQKLEVDADGDTRFRISSPNPEAMAIHTPFHGQQVRKGSDTYVIEGVTGTEILTFKGFDVDEYTGEQMIDGVLGRVKGETYRLGDLISQELAKASENARFFVSEKEIQAGIGFSMLSKGDWVKGTSIIIENAAGNIKEFDVTDYIMDADRMAALNVKAGGDGEMPTDYIVIAITEGSDELRSEINAALAEPGATIKFAADSGLGTRWTTEPIAFGETWASDIALAQQMINAGPNFELPLSKNYERIVSTGFEEPLDHNVGGCEYLMVDKDDLEKYDFYAANIDQFSGMYPRNSEAVITTLAGTYNVVAIGEPYMAGINIENVATTGVRFTQTGSANNVAITMTPEGLRQLTTGCTPDEVGAVVPDKVDVPSSLTPMVTSSWVVDDGKGGFGRGSSFFGFGDGGHNGDGATPPTKTEMPSVSLSPSQQFLLIGLASLGALGVSQAVANRRRGTAFSHNI